MNATTPTIAGPHPATITPDRHLAGTQSSHRWAELPGNFDRLNCRALFPSDSNDYGIPDLPATEPGWRPARLVAYTDRNATRLHTHPGWIDVAVHFFLDDYRFETMWTNPQRALSRPCSVGAALTPDFSLWRDMPLAMQMWQVYRSRWCGAWMAWHGVRVIPTVSWAGPASYRFAFAGIPTGSTVAVSTVGIRDQEARNLFAAGYAEMLRQIQPAAVLVYGKPPTEQGDRAAAGPPVHSYPTRWDNP